MSTNGIRNAILEPDELDLALSLLPFRKQCQDDSKSRWLLIITVEGYGDMTQISSGIFNAC